MTDRIGTLYRIMGDIKFAPYEMPVDVSATVTKISEHEAVIGTITATAMTFHGTVIVEGVDTITLHGNALKSGDRVPLSEVMT